MSGVRIGDFGWRRRRALMGADGRLQASTSSPGAFAPAQATAISPSPAKTRHRHFQLSLISTSRVERHGDVADGPVANLGIRLDGPGRHRERVQSSTWPRAVSQPTDVLIFGVPPGQFPACEQAAETGDSGELPSQPGWALFGGPARRRANEMLFAVAERHVANSDRRRRQTDAWISRQRPPGVQG
jgi:hypothetical protein